MHKGRVEAFSDGVIAIVITIMVLEMKVPHGADLAALATLAPVFLSYVLSFVYVGIYWNNHHHLFQVVDRVDGLVLWANLHLLFWLSLVPFVTGWLGEAGPVRAPVVLYGVVLIGAAIAYTLLVKALGRRHGAGSVLVRALGRGWKETLSLGLYATALIAAVAFEPATPGLVVALTLYVVVAAIWLVPDRRVERALAEVGK